MPLIAMTREMGSLGKDVAAGLAARLNRKVVYHEIIEPIANKMRLRKSHVERFLDGRAGFVIAALAAYYVLLKWAKLWELGEVRGPARR